MGSTSLSSGCLSPVEGARCKVIEPIGAESKEKCSTATKINLLRSNKVVNFPSLMSSTISTETAKDDIISEDDFKVDTALNSVSTSIHKTKL